MTAQSPPSMNAATSRLLACSISAMAVPGILVAHRLISPGDENALLPEEFEAFSRSVIKVRRASGAARIVARELLQQIGAPAGPIPKAAQGMPVWPRGVVGSLAHDAEVAVAAIASARNFLSVGIDVEPAEPLAADLLDMVATPTERRSTGSDLNLGRVLFCIKEAVYKAAYPLDGVFLDHHDVEVRLADGVAETRSGRTVDFRFFQAPSIIVLAFLRALPAA